MRISCQIMKFVLYEIAVFVPMITSHFMGVNDFFTYDNLLKSNSARIKFEGGQSTQFSPIHHRLPRCPYWRFHRNRFRGFGPSSRQRFRINKEEIEAALMVTRFSFFTVIAYMAILLPLMNTVIHSISIYHSISRVSSKMETKFVIYKLI